MKTSSSLTACFFIVINVLPVRAQNDTELYGDWVSVHNIGFYFDDRPGDDVDRGSTTIKGSSTVNGCKCNTTSTLEFDWITEGNKIKMYNKLSDAFVSVDVSCPADKSYEAKKNVEEACRQAADNALAGFVSSYNVSMEMSYSISGSQLNLGGRIFTSTTPRKQPDLVKVDAVEQTPKEIVVLNGYHVKVYDDGSRYEGEWKNDMKNGKGSQISANGEKYEGQWTDNYRDGYGVQTISNGDKYAGEYEMGMRSGMGTYTNASGDYYTGQWKDNNKHGQGKFTWTDGTSYDGQWENDTMQGNGTYTWSNGSSYVGQFQNGTMHGMGTYTSDTGEKTTGEFSNGNFVK